ncbi:MAG TPA: hypothetical protein VLJ85_15540 [Geodermatophilus sp.]|nr:hypothetical protein [Geodermatophilus sp.]
MRRSAAATPHSRHHGFRAWPPPDGVPVTGWPPERRMTAREISGKVPATV